MSTNPNFDPLYSTNRIWRDENTERCLTDDLDAIETELAGKAPNGHTHGGYAPAVHEHTGYAENGHTHTQENITGLIAALAAKAETTHDHTLAQIVGLVAALAGKADLVDGKVPESQLPSYIDDVVDGTLVNTTTFNNVSGTAVTPESDKIYNDTTTNKSYRWSGSQYVPLNSGVALGETSATAYRGDRGKIAYEHSQNGDVHVTTAKKTEWDGKAAGNHVHSPVVVTTAGENLDNYTTPGVWSFPQAYAPTNIPAGTNGWLIVLPWGDGQGTVKQIWMRHGTLGDTDHEVYTRTRVGDQNAWSSWSKFYTTSNPPTAAEVGAIAKSLQMTSDSGNVEYEMAGLDILATITGMPTGMHTGYCPVNSTNAPLSNEAWRFLVHKTGTTYGWVLAFGSYGSVYSGYLNAGTWRGWKCLIDGTSAPLWKHESNGGFYMTANQTVTPSKPLNQCRNGWLLMWSDYDPDTGTTNNADICTTLIPKRNPIGELWGGQGFLCPVATWMDDDTDSDVIHLKKVYVHNTKLVGFAGNNLTDRRDVVLRAVYEY